MKSNTRWLRHIPSGVVYMFDEVFANRGDFEEVTAQGKPISAIPVDEEAKSAPKKTTKKKAEPKAEAIPGVDDASDDFLGSD